MQVVGAQLNVMVWVMKFVFRMRNAHLLRFLFGSGGHKLHEAHGTRGTDSMGIKSAFLHHKAIHKGAFKVLNTMGMLEGRVGHLQMNSFT